MEFLSSAKKKIMERVGMTEKAPPDSVLELQKEKISQLESVVDVLRKNFHKYSTAALQWSQMGCLVSNDVSQFYQRSKSRQKSIEKFAQTNFEVDSTATDVFREQFHRDVLVVFDKWHRKIKILTNQLGSAEETWSSAYKQENRLKAMKERGVKEPGVSIAEVEEEYNLSMKKLDAMKKKLDESIQVMVDSRFEVFDHLLVRLMECQLDFFRSGAKSIDGLSANVSNFRKKFPKGVLPKVIESDEMISDASPPSPGGGRRRSSAPNVSPRASAFADITATSTKSMEYEEEHEDEDEEDEEDDDEEEADEDEDGEGDQEETKTPVSVPPKSGPTRIGSAAPVQNLLDFSNPAPAAKGGAGTGDILMDVFGPASGVKMTPPPSTTTASNDIMADIFGTGASKPGTSSTATKTPPKPVPVVDPMSFFVYDEPEKKVTEPKKGDSKAEVKASGRATPKAKKSTSKAETKTKAPALTPSIPTFTGPPRAPKGFEDTGIDQDKFTGFKPTPKIISVAKGDAELNEDTIKDIVAENQATKVEDFKTAVTEKERLNEERLKTREMLSVKLDEWEFKNGVRKPLRALLMNLSSVLWEGHGYKVDMAAIMSEAGLKKAYMKAVLVCHPDKNRGYDMTRQVIAERVFAALNAANSSKE